MFFEIYKPIPQRLIPAAHFKCAMHNISTVDKFKSLRRYNTYILKHILMKNFIYLSFLLFFIACKKDEPQALSSNITGTWMPVKTTYIENSYTGNTLIKSDTSVFEGRPGEFLSIISTGELSWKELQKGTDVNGDVWYGTTFDTWNTKYVRTGSSLVIGEGADEEFFTITKLTDTQLTLEMNSEIRSSSTRATTHGKLDFKK